MLYAIGKVKRCNADRIVGTSTFDCFVTTTDIWHIDNKLVSHKPGAFNTS